MLSNVQRKKQKHFLKNTSILLSIKYLTPMGKKKKKCKSAAQN